MTPSHAASTAAAIPLSAACNVVRHPRLNSISPTAEQFKAFEAKVVDLEEHGDANARALAAAAEKAIQPGLSGGNALSLFDAVTQVGKAWQRYCH